MRDTSHLHPVFEEKTFYNRKFVACCASDIAKESRKKEVISFRSLTLYALSRSKGKELMYINGTHSSVMFLKVTSRTRNEFLFCCNVYNLV